MSRQYAPLAVIRQLPLELLRIFLSREQIETGLNWDSLAEGDYRSIYQAWLDLPSAQQKQVELMFQYVHEMATPAGVRAMISEAIYRNQDIVTSIEAIDGHHAKALWVLIHYGPVFHTARLLLTAANPVGRYWNLTPGFPGAPADTSAHALQNLKLGIGYLYRTEQGRGQRCTIEPYERNGTLYLFVYLDDYTQTHVGHDARGNLSRSPLRPAFEVIYVYNPFAGTLDLYAQGERRWRSQLRDLFCYHLLDADPPPAQPDRRPYELNGLLDRGFSLSTDPVTGVHRAVVRRLRVVSRGSRRRVILEADPAAGPDDILDMLDDHFPTDRFPRSELSITLATFNVLYQTPDDGRERSLTFDVSFPDACNLRSMTEEQRAIGERCLRRWGILHDEPASGPAHPGRVA